MTVFIFLALAWKGEGPGFCHAFCLDKHPQLIQYVATLEETVLILSIEILVH